MEPRGLAQVCLPVPLDTAFTYAVPAALREGLVPGRRVRVPFGARSADGWCVGFAEPPEPGADGKLPEMKSVEALLDDGPLLGEELLSLSRWIADTYACGWGEALTACVPAGVRAAKAERTILHATLAVSEAEAGTQAAELAEKHPKRSRLLRILLERPAGLALRDLVRAGRCSDSPARTLEKQGLISIESRPVVPDDLLTAPPAPVLDLELTTEQEVALGRVLECVIAGTHRTFVLEGVTGSGKTEVYLRALERCVADGRQGIVLVPEIALTPQTVSRFRARFARVAVLHSALSDAERRRQWFEIRSGGADVVIGPRSAVFAPVPRLGLVVLDEEHETSFKQQSAPRYHARDVAIERARTARAAVVLGSATPALESFERARRGEFELLELHQRVGGGKLPRVDVIDMAAEARETGRRLLFSRRLVQLLRRALERRQQAILFLNRRGFATSLFCARCGGTVTCDRCSVSMTVHRGHNTIQCHPCGRERPIPLMCPECRGAALSRIGTGTERLEDVLREVVPGVRVARMDSDVMHDRASYEEVLERFGSREVDVLLGTQMIAKGLHFPNVTVVGVVSADTALLRPDFRAAERTFQLVAQVAGRAGRSKDAGNVVVQTVQPRHPALLCAARHDFRGFALDELKLRRRYGWPPFTRLARVVVTSRDDGAARRRAEQIAAAVGAALPPGSADVLGPARCPIERVRHRFRWQVLVRAADEPVLRAAVLRLRRFSRRARGTEATIDVDPADLS